MSSNSTQSPAKKTSFRLLLTFLIISALLGAAIWAFRAFNLSDRLRSIGYTHPAPIAALEDELQLTGKARIIFAASKPKLDSQEDFNEHCRSHDARISVLGCYIYNTIYLYNIQSAELQGIIQSTAAHELLHAVWSRLSTNEKNRLRPSLEAVFQQHQNLLAGDLELYDTSDQLDELHSRIGVEIKDLPDELEAHYAQYFVDQDYIVSFYDSYSQPFKRLSAEIDALSAELETTREAIDSATQQYYQRAENLTTSIDEFNNCANTTNCFVSQAEFTTKRNALATEQEELIDLYQELNDQVETYNRQVEQYNNNILRTRTLENAINSNAPPDDKL